MRELSGRRRVGLFLANLLERRPRVLVLLVVVLLASACSASDDVTAPTTASPASSTPVTVPETDVTPVDVTPVDVTPVDVTPVDVTPVDPTPVPTTEVAAEATVAPTQSPDPDLRDLDPDDNLQLAPLGTFVVATEGAGLRREAEGVMPARFDIPVYNTPLGPPQTLLDINDIDGTFLPRALINWSDADGVLVLRVIAGGPDDEWLIVQAPVRPHNRYVWVERSDFDFGFTSQRIEIDLAGAGQLVLYDGSSEILRSDIVHGRPSRETPVHLTYIETGIRNGVDGGTPAYGNAVLSMASYSEALGTFGSGGLPTNFLHGTNLPGLMGQQVSSGEVRVPNEALEQIIGLVTPGTPVLLFNSSAPGEDKASILERLIEPASTAPFEDGAAFAVDWTTTVTPKLWTRCPQLVAGQLVCRMGLNRDGPGGAYPYLTAKEGAGELNQEVGANVVPVYDVPGGSPRTLVHQPPDGLDYRLPLRSQNRLGSPLVLWPLEISPDEQWIRVQAPVHPQRTSVWVRAEDFDIGWSDYRIEIDIAGPGELTLFDGDVELISNIIVSGRESRPTPLGASYIDQVADGTKLSPAYGPYLLSIPIYNDELATFGGTLALQFIHGTNQPELMGQQVASGHIRIPNEVISFMAEQPGGLLGARVVTFDSTGTSRADAIIQQELKPWRSAMTTDPGDESRLLGIPGL